MSYLDTQGPRGLLASASIFEQPYAATSTEREMLDWIVSMIFFGIAQYCCKPHVILKVGFKYSGPPQLSGVATSRLRREMVGTWLIDRRATGR